MLHATEKPSEKRRAFREALNSGKLLRFPGAHSPIVALSLARMGFEGIYISGAAMSAELGLPDIGLTTLSEIATRGHQIARVTDLPTIIDADTGFGEPMNSFRTVRELEDAGLAGCHIEDQVNPKRCGHLDSKQVVETNVAVRRVASAARARHDENFVVLARTDAKAIEGIDSAIDRAKAYVDAGADGIFPEALHTESEFEQFREALPDVPLLANMTEFGKSPLLTTEQLRNLGYNIVIYPVTSLRLMMKAVEETFAEIDRRGTQDGLQEQMQTRSDLYELLRYTDYNEFDQGLFNFTLRDDQ